MSVLCCARPRSALLRLLHCDMMAERDAAHFHHFLTPWDWDLECGHVIPVWCVVTMGHWYQGYGSIFIFLGEGTQPWSLPSDIQEKNHKTSFWPIIVLVVLCRPISGFDFGFIFTQHHERGVRVIQSTCGQRMMERVLVFLEQTLRFPPSSCRPQSLRQGLWSHLLLQR